MEGNLAPLDDNKGNGGDDDPTAPAAALPFFFVFAALAAPGADSQGDSGYRNQGKFPDFYLLAQDGLGLGNGFEFIL